MTRDEQLEAYRTGARVWKAERDAALSKLAEIREILDGDDWSRLADDIQQVLDA